MTFSTFFYACASCSMFCEHFRSGLVSRGQLQIIVVDSRRCRKAPGSDEVKLGNCGDIGTGTNSGGSGTHIQFKIQWSLGTGTKSVWYRYPSAI